MGKYIALFFIGSSLIQMLGRSTSASREGKKVFFLKMLIIWCFYRTFFCIFAADMDKGMIHKRILCNCILS